MLCVIDQMFIGILLLHCFQKNPFHNVQVKTIENHGLPSLMLTSVYVVKVQYVDFLGDCYLKAIYVFVVCTCITYLKSLRCELVGLNRT
jgi:hypothetical protein